MKLSSAMGLKTGAALLSLLLSGCTGLPSATGVDQAALTPRLAGGNTEALDDISGQERAHLQLIATNLVATLAQIPEMRPTTATLQINTPQTAFGNVIRALEDAGFGMQLVTADQGQNFVSYSKRFSETESGLVTDYTLAVGKIRLSREYIVNGNAVYPSSLLNISGTDSIADIELADNIFAEQAREMPSSAVRSAPESPTRRSRRRLSMSMTTMNSRKTSVPARTMCLRKPGNAFSKATPDVVPRTSVATSSIAEPS